MNLSLVDAFGRFGAKPSSRLRSLSAIAADDARQRRYSSLRLEVWCLPSSEPLQPISCLQSDA